MTDQESFMTSGSGEDLPHSQEQIEKDFFSFTPATTKKKKRKERSPLSSSPEEEMEKIRQRQMKKAKSDVLAGVKKNYFALLGELKEEDETDKEEDPVKDPLQETIVEGNSEDDIYAPLSPSSML